MAEPAVAMDVRKPNPRASIIDVKGSINSAAEQVLMDAYATASTSDTRAIILNFTELEYMNSSGIGLLVTLLVRANRQRQKLMAYGLSEHYQHIFDLTRLNEAISIFNNEQEALSAANTA